MEKAIECGIRMFKEKAMVSDAEWQTLETSLLDRCIAGLKAQRRVLLNLDAGTTKDFGGYRIEKGVEFYCRMKGADISFQEEKGIECGIRIKQYILELPDDVFANYLSGARDVLQRSLTEQRAILLEDAGMKDFVIGGREEKGVELYCEIKSMCGGA